MRQKTHELFEIRVIISDDNSQDGTQEILKQLKLQYPQIQLILHDKNQGYYGNYLSTFALATNEYLAYIEGDDYWIDDHKLYKQFNLLEKNKDCVVGFALHQEVDADDKLLDIPQFKITPDSANNRFFFKTLLHGNFIFSPTVVYRNVHPGKFLPTFFKDSPTLDWPLHLSYAEKGPIILLPELVSSYRRHVGGLWSLKTPEQIARNWLKTCELCIQMWPAQEIHLNYSRGKTYIDLFFECLKKRNYEEAKSIVKIYFSLKLQWYYKIYFILRVLPLIRKKLFLPSLGQEK